MSFMRKISGAWLIPGVKPNSKKERTANAAEKQAKHQKELVQLEKQRQRGES